MNTLLTVKILLPLSVLALGAALLLEYNSGGKRPQLTPRQAAMIDSLKSASPSQKEIK